VARTDAFINPFYLGDYDTLTTDSTKSTLGFIGAFQIIQSVGGEAPNSVFVPNPDVFAVSSHESELRQRRGFHAVACATLTITFSRREVAASRSCAALI
jgi:hypothetical protein